MGCSPSKGKLFSKPEGTGPDNAPLSEATQDCIDSGPIQEESTCLENNEKENELPQPTEEYPTKEAASSQLASITSCTENVDDIKETEVNEKAQEIVTEPVQTVQVKKTEKRKKNKGQRRSSERKKHPILQAKLDFPPHMVRAHQAAYAFLNPNISKYETLLGLLDQAAQTQLSLQPMMSALVLRFEEINQGLEEMAEEGELMLKEHGDYMALPSGMMGPVIMHAKATISPPDPPPDLLQQLLQHSTEKMRLVAGSAQALGDTTLEEAVEYFSLLSKLLGEKLHAKRAAERKLAQVLARVEGAAMRKSNPEDSALHSEDSGIGGENESLTGSERHRHHRGSAGSGSCGSGTNIRGAFDTLSGNLPNLVGHNEDGEEEEEGDDDEDDDDDDDYVDDEGDRPARKRSNSSPPDPTQALIYLRANYMRHQQPGLKRPLTAAISDKLGNKAATKRINMLVELQNSQRDLNQRFKKMGETTGYKDVAGPHLDLYRGGLRRHSLSGSAIAQKESLNQSPCSLPHLTAQQTKRQSVRRLINTFSHGVDGRPGQSLANIPPHIIRPGKSGLPPLTDTVNGNDRGVALNGNQNNNTWPDGRDDMDVDNLPPPPPEVLMDNSFQSSEGLPGNEARSTKDSVRTLPLINQRSGASQRLKASMQNVELLPSRTIVRPKLIGNLPDHPIRQDALMGMQDTDRQPDTDHDPETKTKSLYQQARKIIHLRNAAENPNKARLGQRCESTEFYEAEMSSSCLPVTAPPVSRVRLPPSCPTVCHRYPTPPMGRPQTNSRPSSRPGSPRTVTRASDNSAEEIIPSVSFKEARSVFCQKESQNSQSFISAGGSVLPRPWAEGQRGRLPMRRTDSTTRRTQSEQRPSIPTHSEFNKEGS